MLKGMLTTIVTVAFVLCGATIGLEALGLMFHVGTADPEHRIEAAVAKIEANLDPMNVPREPEADALWPVREPRQAVAAPTLQEELAASAAQATADAGQLPEPSIATTPSPVAMAAASVDDGSAGASAEAPAAEAAATHVATHGATHGAAPEPAADDAAAPTLPAAAPAPATVAAATPTPPAPAGPASAETTEPAGSRAAASRSRHHRQRAAREPATTMVQARSGPECPGCRWLEAVAAEPDAPSRSYSTAAGHGAL